jgi:hypothetical protein
MRGSAREATQGCLWNSLINLVSTGPRGRACSPPATAIVANCVIATDTLDNFAVDYHYFLLETSAKLAL